MNDLKLSHIKKLSWLILRKDFALENIQLWSQKYWIEVKDRVLQLTTTWEDVDVDFRNLTPERLDKLNSFLSEMCRTSWRQSVWNNQELLEIDKVFTHIPHWLQGISVIMWWLITSFRILLNERKLVLNPNNNVKKSLKINIEMLKILQVIIISIRKMLKNEKGNYPDMTTNFEEVMATSKRLMDRLEKLKKTELEWLKLLS